MTEAAAAKADGAQRARVARGDRARGHHSGEPASRLIWIYAIAIGAFQGVTSMLALFSRRASA